jgi:hypothetical protein
VLEMKKKALPESADSLEAWFDEYVKGLPTIKSADPNNAAFVYPGTEEDWLW